MKGLIKDMLKDNIEFYNSILPGKETVRGSKNPTANFIDAGIYSNIKHSLEKKNIENIPLLTILSTDLNRVNKTTSDYNHRSLHDYVITIWYNKPTCTYLIATRDKTKYSSNCSVSILGFLNEPDQNMFQVIETKMINNILFNNRDTILLSESKSFIDIMKSIYFSFNQITAMIREKDHERYDGTDEKNPVYVPNYMLKLMLSVNTSSYYTPYSISGLQSKSLDFNKDIANVSDILISGDHFSSSNGIVTKKSTIIRERLGDKKILKVINRYDKENNRYNNIVELDFNNEEDTIKNISKAIFDQYYNIYTDAISKAVLDDCKDYFDRYEIFRLLFPKEDNGEITVTRDRYAESIIDEDRRFKNQSLDTVKYPSEDYLDNFVINTDKYQVIFNNNEVLYNVHTNGYKIYSVKIFDKNKSDHKKEFVSEKLIDCVTYFVDNFYNLKDINSVIDKVYKTISKDWITEMDNSNIIDDSNIEYNMRHKIKSIISLINLNMDAFRHNMFDYLDDPFNNMAMNTLNKMGHYIRGNDIKKHLHIEYNNPLIKLTYSKWIFLNTELEQDKIYTVPSVFLSLISKENICQFDACYSIRIDNGKIELYTSDKFPISDGVDRTFLMSNLEKTCIKKFLVSTFFEHVCTGEEEVKILPDGLLVTERSNKPLLQRMCEFIEILGSLEDINNLLLINEGLYLTKNNKGIFHIHKLSKKVYGAILKGKEDASTYNVFSKNYVRPRVKGGK